MHKLKDRLQIVRNQEKPKALESVASALDAQPSPEMGMPDNPAQMAAVAKAAKATPPKIDLASSGGVKKTKRALHRMVDRALQRDFHGLDVVENSKKALKKGAHALIEGKKIHFAPGMLADMPQGQDLLRHEGMIQEIEKQLKGGSDIREIADKLGNGAKEILSQGSISNSPSMAPAANGMFKAPANVVANAPEPLLNLVSGNDGATKQELPSESDLLNMKLPVQSEEDIARGEEQEEENEQAIESKERNEQPEKESAEQKTKDKEKEAGEGQEGEGAEKEGEEAAKEGKEEGKKDGKQGVKDRQGKAKDKADKKKGKKGKAGAEEKGEDKKGDEAQSAAAEGAGQEIQSKIESSQSAVGAAAATGSEGGVQEQPAAENSGPANVGMTIANAAAVQAAGVQGNVIKEIGTNEEGEAVFVVAGPVEAAAEGGDAGDGKPKPKVKAMPGDMQGDMEAANREKIQAAIAEFQSQAAGEVSQLNGLSGSASSQVMAGAESAKGSVTSAAASQKAAVTAAIAAQKAAVQAGAETAKAQAQSALEAQMAALAAGAESAKAELESQWAAQDAALAAMEGEMIGKINAAVNKAKTDLTQVAETKAQEATAIGEQRAAQYEAEPLAQQSGWEDFTNGSDYPKNKRDAKVKAARETAKKFAESFKQKAQEAVAKIGGEGTAQLTNYITQSVAGGRQAIAQRKTAAIAQIDTSRSATEAQLQSSHQTTVASIDASAQSTQASLDQQQGGAIAQIEGAAQGKIQGISQAAAQTAAALQQQAQQALESLNAQIAAAVASVQGRKEQNPVAIKQALAQSLEAIRTGVSQARTGVEGAATASTAGFQQQASEGAAEMAQKATEASSSAQTTASGAVSGMTAQASGFASSAAGQVSAATASMTQQAQQAGTEMAGQVTAIRTDFEATIAKVVAQFEKDKTAFNSTLQAEIGKLPAEITSQAEKAEKAVQPRWKSIVMFVVNIVVMILITAAVIAAFASGGILLAIGVALLAGAAGGILKYGVQQGLNGEPMTWQGVAKAGFEGAMDGLNIAAGVVGGPAAQILTGAAVGAAKYAGGFAIDYAFASDEQRANMQFSFGQMAMGAAGGAIEGALGALGGHYADGMGPGIRNFVGGKIIEATADTVGSALAAPFNHYAQTGEWDPGKILEELSPQNLAQNFIMGVAVDKGVGRMTGGGSSTPSTSSSTPSTSNSATPTTTPATTNSATPTTTPVTPTTSSTPVTPTTTNTPVTPTTNTNPVTPTTNTNPVTPTPNTTPVTPTTNTNPVTPTPNTNPVTPTPNTTPVTPTPDANTTPSPETRTNPTPETTTPETTTPSNRKPEAETTPETTPDTTPETTPENERGITHDKPAMEQNNMSLDGRDASIKFNELSPAAQSIVRRLENNRSARVDRISPQDLAALTKWFGKEVGVLQSVYRPGLRIIVGQGKSVGGKDVRPGETFVAHTHPVYTSYPSHLSGTDVPSMANAGKKVEAVVDLSGNVIFFDKSGVLNPRNNDGTVGTMHPEFNSGFIDAEGFIVGYARLEITPTPDGKTRVTVRGIGDSNGKVETGGDQTTSDKSDTTRSENETTPNDTGRSNPPTEAPVGYHWKLRDGQYILSRNPNMSDSLPPLQYDPSTGGFKNTETGQPHDGNMALNTVRGQDMNGFASTVKGLDPTSPVAKQAFELYATKKWPELEALFKQHNLNDGWPPNRGFISIKDGTLPVGAKFDRFGGYIDKTSGQFTDKGTFVAPYGSDYTGRALPKGTDSKAFKGYEVIKPIPMKEGPAIPWFGEKGNGMQYELSMGIKDLIDGGYIREVAAPDLSAMKDPQGTTSTTSTTKTPETTTADPAKTTTPTPETNTTPTPENTTPNNANPTNTNPTNTNGDGDNGGGGMKGADVYQKPADPKDAVSALKPAELNALIESAVGNYGAVDGARVRPTNKPGVFKMVFTKRPSGSNLPASVEVTFKVSDDGAFKTNTAASSHGSDQGPAINRVVYDSKTGTFKVEIELNGAYNKADVDKMALHELNEVADIILSVDTKKSQAEINSHIADQQKASVFDQSADPSKPVNSADMTAHDKAVIKEVKQLVEDANSGDPVKDAAARQKLEELGKSMGIKSPSDARMATLLESIPGLNADQIAALCGRPAAPAGYTWVRDAENGIAVQNLPNNKGPVREYNPLDATSTPPFFPVSKTARPTPDRFAQETTTSFTLGTVSSKADPQSGVQSIEIDSTQLSDPEKQRLADIQQERTNAKIKKDSAGNEKDRSDAHGELVRASESLGDAATEIAIAKMLPGAKKIECELPGNGKSGQFDSVYEHNGQIYVVESKGASSERGTRQDSSGKHNEQGTKEYLDSIVENMEAKIRKSKADPAYTSDPNFKKKIDDLQATVDKIKDADLMGTLNYLQVSQRIQTSGSNKGQLAPIEILKFDI